MTHEDRIRKLRSLAGLNARTARYPRQFCAALDLGDWHGCEGAILNMQSEAVRIAAASHVAGIVATMRQVLAESRKRASGWSDKK